MANKGFYHTQPCFCMPCRALKRNGNSGVAETADVVEDQPKKKSRVRKKS